MPCCSLGVLSWKGKTDKALILPPPPTSASTIVISSAYTVAFHWKLHLKIVFMAENIWKTARPECVTVHLEIVCSRQENNNVIAWEITHHLCFYPISKSVVNSESYSPLHSFYECLLSYPLPITFPSGPLRYNLWSPVAHFSYCCCSG